MPGKSYLGEQRAWALGVAPSIIHPSNRPASQHLCTSTCDALAGQVKLEKTQPLPWRSPSCGRGRKVETSMQDSGVGS